MSKQIADTRDTPLLVSADITNDSEILKFDKVRFHLKCRFVITDDAWFNIFQILMSVLGHRYQRVKVGRSVEIRLVPGPVIVKLGSSL